jgi:hypothetical protein
MQGEEDILIKNMLQILRFSVEIMGANDHAFCMSYIAHVLDNNYNGD